MGHLPIYIHATMTNLIICFPDWNSLESVRRAHSYLEAGALVFFALLVASEALAHLSRDKKKENFFDRIGICFFAVAVFAEIAAYPYGQRNDTLSEKTIGSLSDKATKAEAKATSAIEKATIATSTASTAETTAGQALDKSNAANIASGKATASVSNALYLASGARQEADTFEKDIVSAKTQAAKAESHLADALKQAADATEALNSLKKPRSIENISEMIDILTPFKDTQYTFSSVFADNESIQLLKAIDYVLQRAGWKRGASIGGFPSIAPFEDKKYGVPAALSDGLLISMESTQEISVLKATHINLLPAPLGAAIALRQALASDLSPPEESSAMIDVEKGTSMTIKISVGKKR